MRRKTTSLMVLPVVVFTLKLPGKLINLAKQYFVFQVRRVQQGSLERSFGMNPSSPPDFDFPPPPADLPPPSPSPRSGRKSTDKENLPERLERNSKLAKFREVQSSDSCESLGLNSNQQVKSPMSPVSENRTLGSPAVGSLSSPGSTLGTIHILRKHF